ncbi:ADP-ribosylation factor-like protein 16 isoform X1 [Melozone crissalis]|uniref:ADP-ribosylation factor-like protein 16 isoform X1 n=1 Tax=Melozone crissalis TaxID=40204 RepID=UPI0023D9BC43|nr:ADP-ribosylation factor-like protein 16 isoform X1 [Melozone crissalis]
MAAGRSPPTFLLLGAAGGGKSLLVRRLRQLSAEQPAELGEPPATLPTVGTNLTDLRLPRRVTVRELGGCMGPIWPSYYSECSALLVGEQHRGRGPGVLRGHGLVGRCPGFAPVRDPLRRAPLWPGPARVAPGTAAPRFPCSLQFVVDASNPTQLSSSCIQLLSVLSAAPLSSVPVLVLFNKIDLPCYMSLVEMKSLLRMQDMVACATQPITMLETSARDGTGLAEVLQWLRSTLREPC